MRPSRLARPTVDTPFQINLDWWERHQQDFTSYLRDALCQECLKQFPADVALTEIDLVDPVTAEVRRLNSLWACLVETCSRKPGYISPELPLATALFRALLTRGNAPLSPNDMQHLIGRSSPQTILRVLTGPTPIFGILPAE